MNPLENSIIREKYFCHPIVWRVAMVSMTKSVNYIILGLVVNTIFCIAALFVTILIKKRLLDPW